MKGRKMHDCWWTNAFSTWSILLLIGTFRLNSIFCLSLNHEGIALLKFRERVVSDPYGALSSWNEENGETNPCSWFGIECADGHVISMNLKNMCLKGTLAPELHHLLHIKSIILRNNSFSGFIPGEIRNLKELELLDLGYNNFCEPIQYEVKYNIPIILLDNNVLSCHISPELDDLMQSKVNARKIGRTKDGHRIMLQDQFQTSEGASGPFSPPEDTSSIDNTAAAPRRVDSQSPPAPDSDGIAGSRPNNSPPPPTLNNSPPPPSPDISIQWPPHENAPEVWPPAPEPSTPDLPPPSLSSANGTSRRLIPIIFGAAGGFIGLILISLLIFLLRGKRIRSATGFSGQLRRAFVLGKDRSDGLSSDKPSFVEGIPNFKRSELLTACEDFSNVIGSSSIGTIYKGTLSNGVEIAAIPLAVTSAKDWSKNLETQFRKKIEVLSKVNHKNFVNLIGYCEEEEPFTRLMVFEYAPNGSLFEHLHVREAEHLDWGMRLRVAMGMAYCLEHMHSLTPPVTHPNLASSAVNLSEDYAAKLSDFCFWNEVAAPRVQPAVIGMSSLSTISLSPESNVYSFGLLLLEMMTGCISQSLEDNSLDDWVLEYMRGEKPLQEMIDPMLRHFNPEQLEKISEVIRKCLHSEQNRPKMSDVTAKLKEVTGIVQDKAVPRFSSLWWMELDARSVNGT